VAADCNRVFVFVDTFLEFCCFLELVEVVVTFFLSAGFGVQASFPNSTDAPRMDHVSTVMDLPSFILGMNAAKNLTSNQGYKSHM